jgi:aminoglycoside phosphotransferase (APT) family kinase protein
MHADELDIDGPLVRRLLEASFPRWAHLPLKRVPSAGTDNALYRLGDDMVVRLPRIDSALGGIAKDFRWLPELAPLLPVPVPMPLGRGAPGEGYPWEWGVYSWLEGENPVAGSASPADALKVDLTGFIQALRRVPPAGAPPARRGHALEGQDKDARAALARLGGLIDTGRATAAWDEALGSPPWSGPPMWVHGDLLPGNLLIGGGRLAGVIDWDGAGVGDPACDMIAAWSVLSPAARESFRGALGMDPATWARGRGWALSIGLIALPYYQDTNPDFAAIARHMIEQVIGGA